MKEKGKREGEEGKRESGGGGETLDSISGPAAFASQP